MHVADNSLLSLSLPFLFLKNLSCCPCNMLHEIQLKLQVRALFLRACGVFM